MSNSAESIPASTQVVASALFGLSLSEAFRMVVLEDPNVETLGKMIVERDTETADVFENGRYPGAYPRFVWPLNVSVRDFAFEFVRPMVFAVPGPPIPEPSDLHLQVSALIVERLRILRRVLVGGQVVAHGTFVGNGSFGPINRLQWAHSGVSIDVRDGDLLQEVDNRDVVQWSGLVLEAPPNWTLTSKADVSREVYQVRSLTTDMHSSAPGAAATAKTTPHRASIDAAISALWPEGIPTALPLKTRDDRIMAWQKGQGFAVSSSKTIRRHIAKGR